MGYTKAWEQESEPQEQGLGIESMRATGGVRGMENSLEEEFRKFRCNNLKTACRPARCCLVPFNKRELNICYVLVSVLGAAEMRLYLLGQWFLILTAYQNPLENFKKYW